VLLRTPEDPLWEGVPGLIELLGRLYSDRLYSGEIDNQGFRPSRQCHLSLGPWPNSDEPLTFAKIEELTGLRAKDQVALALKNPDVIAAMTHWGWTVGTEKTGGRGRPRTVLIMGSRS
jgi:hypothetical protein